MSSVSVIIPTYNYGGFIAQAIGSVLTQTLKPAEIIVVDDGSTDETESIVKSLGDKVRYIRQENAGVCAARNNGVAESTGRYIAFLDADDHWEPTKLEKQLRKFEEDPGLGLVHCGMRHFDSETGQTLDVLTDGQEGWVADELLLWERPAVNVSGSAVMVTRDAFDAVKGFDARQRVGEDWDFCYWVARKFRVGFIREPLVNYRIHPRAAHNNIPEMERGMGLFYEKAFATADPNIHALKNRAYGNFHRILAGSYFQSGYYGAFLKHAVKSLKLRPFGIGYFLEFPVRRLRNGRKRKDSLGNSHF
jgi:glycosyltransferase involved in cell wall biosynthesis